MTSATYFLYSAPPEVGPYLHFGIVAALCCCSAYNGGTWYAKSIHRFAKGIDDLIADAKKKPKAE